MMGGRHWGPIQWSAWTLALGCALLPWGAAAQEVPATETIAVFEDCQTFGCDSDFFRTEIPWVNWVRDRQVADVHLLVTAQSTGGGGRHYSLSFLGRGPFEGRSAELTYTSSGDATRDEERNGLVRVIQRGLLPFVEGTPAAERLSIQYQAPAPAPGAAPGAGGPAATEVDDPWDFWVFTARMNGSLSGESSVSSYRLSGSLNARRTTEDWKLSLGSSYSTRETKYELPDRTVTSDVQDWSASGLAVRSLGSHWSLGGRFETGSSTYLNQDLHVRAAPGLEYSFFPYAESTRRQVTLLWSVGVNHWNYEEETLFGHMEETRLDQSLNAQVDFTQPWGQASVFGETAHYFHDTSKWRASLGGHVQLRLFKGFNFNMGGSYVWVRDQLYIAAGEATDDEILTRQRQLATNYRASTFVGISYTFGSIFNNVVNPRFGGSSGGMMIFF